MTAATALKLSHMEKNQVSTLFSPLLLRFTIQYLLTPEKSKLYHSQHLIFVLSCMWTMETGFRVKLSDPKSSLLANI